MHVISKRALREFWESRGHDSGLAERALSSWFATVEKTDWPNFAALRETYSSVDKVGQCYVFDIAHNRFRLIAKVRFREAGQGGLVYVRRVMDHEEYSKNQWPDQCGCHDPSPRTVDVSVQMPKGGKPAKGGRRSVR